ncbi:unnamed protein product [Brassica rapa subsp. trilocularis]|uniref:(rape) hypothetical protein n=1 Tax=Brassica napus TaxID=3708 RepID=A0A078JKC9_BRANA|nr:unnamed protein product [Brassica napus]CDY14444.1 BnaC03g21510D [Brassica napus]CDY66890.1 BnaAnng23160D [Brassica napus]
MAITIKILVAFVFTALFIVFSVHCRPTTASIPGYGVKQMDIECVNGGICRLGGAGACHFYCRDHGYYYAVCTTDAMCCCKKANSIIWQTE